MSEDQDRGSEGFWGIVEIFGHQRIAGFVSSQTVGGQSFVRVDVPATTKQAAWSKLYGAGAIYAMTPMAEDLVRQRANALEVAPLTAWDLPEEWRAKIRQPALPEPVSSYQDGPYEPEDDED